MEWEDLIIAKQRGLKWTGKELGEFNLFRMIEHYLFIFHTVSSEFSSVFHSSVYTSRSWYKENTWIVNFVFDK